ncbi:PREDICTED: putative MORF4 family-associated protein 1-like protein UPP [Myotis davidii]|uniref:putative MORF4 family-associated protein 1-like protein UPP n=1 Tax=Myotis davidii TaxID=225400 RepID=UPI0003EC5EDE|nr:PREDICTED: putative MORF4 family-associated protein 1-like protein UPP [Myotis davidii]
MQPVVADKAPEPELEWERVPSPALAAARRDVSALEREHVRAHLRPRRLQEMGRLLHAVHRAEPEERVGKLCEKVEKKAVEAALVGKRTVETHQQIGSHECR